MRNGPTASATDTAMRNSWNEKKKNQSKLQSKLHVLSKFWGFHDHPIPDVP